MRTPFIFGTVFWLSAAFLWGADSDLRTWTSSGGGHTLKAEYLGKKGKDKAYLLREDKRLVTVRLDALSDDDRSYIEEAENPDPDWTGGSGPDAECYRKARRSVSDLFGEIEEWKDDEDFQSIGFDPSGPFFRWQLQVKKVRKSLLRDPDGENTKTNIGLLADAAGELLELGEDYADSGGGTTSQTRKKSEYVKGVLDALTDDPSEEPGPVPAAGGAAAGEPNPFEEETAPAPKKAERPAGPKSRRPKVEEEDGESRESASEEAAAPSRNRRGRRQGGLIPLLGSWTDQNGDEDAPAGEPEKVTYAQFKQIKMEMTKKEVFAVLGKGTKVTVPFVDSVVNTGIEVYLWENDDELGGCEITFVDGKVDNKMWNGPGEEDTEEGSESGSEKE